MLPPWLSTCYLALVTVLIAAGRPEAFRRLLVKATAAAAFRFSRAKRRRSVMGVCRCFPHLSKRQVVGLVKSGFRFCWEELFWQCPTSRQWREVKEADISGLHHLRRALDAGRGAVLWEVNTFGLRTAAKLVLADRGLRVVQVHSLAHLGGLRDDLPGRSWVRRRLLRPCFERWERRFADSILYLDPEISLAYTRRLREHLAANRLVTVTADGSRGYQRMAIPFLGSCRQFATGMVSLAKNSGTQILPLFAWRDGSGRLQVVVESPMRIADTGDRRTDLELTLNDFARRFESLVRCRPEQYYGWHLGDPPPPPC